MSVLQNGNSSTPSHTLTALNRWSVANKQLPPIDSIKTLHVYDFDNTLFNSPLPNPKLWIGATIGFLQSQDTCISGGWWHDARILSATGEGLEKEEPRAWKGWWNERIVELVELSMQQKDALTVLLTGRSESAFSELIKKMVASKKLEFDIISLKPVSGPNNQRFSSTMNFKQVFLESLIETYKDAEEIRIYEDRGKHIRAFREFFANYNKAQSLKATRGLIAAEVIHVADRVTQLDPVTETAEVQRLLNDHNLPILRSKRGRPFLIKKTVFYTGYMISQADSQKLLTLAQIPPNLPESEVKFLANNILITPRPAHTSVLAKIGGVGSMTKWQVTGTAIHENNIWAARVRPVPETKIYYTENPLPIVILALRKGARPIDAGKIQNWQPVLADKQIIFESIVGEKVLLRIEEEDPQESDFESLFPNKSHKRKHAPDEDAYNRDRNYSYGNHTSARGGGTPNNNSKRGGRGNLRSTISQRGNRAGRGRGRGGGPTYVYRSLDDVDKWDNNASQATKTNFTYEDFPAFQRQHQNPQPLVQHQVQNLHQYQPQLQGRVGLSGEKRNAELQYS
ncbi:hypothetical protein BGHDH14_bgh04975 [Blumeria hordei DH14]|uniref:Swiss Army Knife RNA repair protein HAD domain-containing protein n=1 Tax=Blumeria graminis f. sp. hordei (strain DH14) TaxID=546991 RepID=N1J789_BLUG1|nr:hypothetical protein BGHDH14_bgh04975 [Blumeria hordei DH14]